MNLSQAEMDIEEEKIPHLAKLATQAAYQKAIDLGETVLIAREGQLIEVSATSRKVVGQTAPRVHKSRRVYKMQWPMTSPD